MSELVDYSVAKSYGQAVFELADDEGKADEVYQEMCGLGDLLNSDVDFRVFMNSPFIASKEKIAFIGKVFGDKLSKIVFNFLCVLVNNNRFNIFGQIKSHYLELLDDRNGLLWVQASFAAEPGKKIQDDMIKKLESVTDKKIKLEKIVNPSLIGGVVIKCKDKVVDNSIKSALDRAVKRIKEIN